MRAALNEPVDNPYEEINMTEIKADIRTVTESMTQLQEVAIALGQISNKTAFVDEMIYILNYMCRAIGGCHSGNNNYTPFFSSNKRSLDLIQQIDQDALVNQIADKLIDAHHLIKIE